MVLPCSDGVVRGSAGVTDHGALTGLGDDDHPQYQLRTEAVSHHVRVVKTTNQSLTGTPVIDGISTAAGNVVLLTGQSTASNNGPWVVASGAWSRPTWFDTSAECITGMIFVVQEGAFGAGRRYYLATTGITLGSTSLTILPVTKDEELIYADGSIPAGNTIANTATRTAFASSTSISAALAATLRVGDVIRIVARGFHSATGTPTLTLEVELGGVVGFSMGALTVALNATSLGWCYTAEGVVTAIGSGGTLEINGEGVLATSASTALNSLGTNIGAIAFNTTGAITVIPYGKWSTANVLNTVTLHTLTVEVIKASQ